MGGAQSAVYLSSAWITSGAAGWKVVGVADMNCNAVPVLIWQNTTAGAVLV